MFELIAQGPEINMRWRRAIAPEAFQLGRATPTHRVPWDRQISRCHVILEMGEERLKVQRVEGAANPVFYNGKEIDKFSMGPGDHFVIGSTTFTLADDKAFATLHAPNPISQKTFSTDFLKKVVYRDADRRVDILNRLPEVISSAGDSEELLIRMTNMLISGISTASTVAIVALSENLRNTESSEDAGSPSIDIVHWDRRGVDAGDFQPSGSLIQQAIETDESVLHIWHQSQVESQYTIDYENDWAFVCPMNSVASSGWGIYVSGKNRSGSSSADSNPIEPDLQGDIKFVELIGSTLKNLLVVKKYERQAASLRSFFAPVVMEAISGKDPDEVLTPRACDVAVLFCDLRGFSRTSEELADQLFKLLSRVNESLSIVTNGILEHDGVIGDFHGDSAMGFWGWPIEPDDPATSSVKATLAALDIQQAFLRAQQESNLESFEVGIGIASGAAVAGKIGSRDQVKVTAFGPIVNLAARLEGMTRLVNSGVLVDEETAIRVEKSQLSEVSLRRIAKIQPFGMGTTVNVYQVSKPDLITDEQMDGYAEALLAFESGNWQQARELLVTNSNNDGIIAYLIQFMDKLNNQAPTDWDGVIPLGSK